MNKFVILQVRTGSTRLPGKALLNICGKTVIEHIIDRAKNIDSDGIIVAVPDSEGDFFCDLILKTGVFLFKGDEENLISRYFFASKKYGVDIIIRLTGDNLFIHPEFCSLAVEKLIKENADYVNIVGAPIGTGVDVFTFKALEKAYNFSDLTSDEKEHIIPVFFRNDFKKAFVEAEGILNFPELRLTLDTKEDYKFVRVIYEKIYKEGEIIDLKDVIGFVKENPDVLEINKDVRQKKWKSFSESEKN